MKEIAEIGKKYGALGVMSVWMFMNTIKIAEIEDELRSCNESKVDIYRGLIPRQVNSNKKISKSVKLIAILPKNNEDEKRKKRA